MDLLHDLFFDYTIRTVAMGTAVLGIVSGALGSFAVLRRESLLGDALSHAALPGVALAFMLTGQKTPIVLMLGAAVAGVLSILAIQAITSLTRIKEDAALGLSLSVFFGFGLMLLTFLQRNPDARQAGLNTFLFGQAATMIERDVRTMALFGGIALLALIVLWKEFKVVSFDADFAASIGFPVAGLEILLTSLLVVAIVIGLQAVGVVLMSAMVVAPAAAARQWTDRLNLMVVLAGLFGAIAGVSGALISSMGARLSTGPVIVLVISAIAIASIVFAPSRGLVWRWVKRQRDRRDLQENNILVSLYRLQQQHEDPDYTHSVEALRVMNAGRAGVRQTLRTLLAKGLVDDHGAGQWHLTDRGYNEAQRILDPMEMHR